MRWTAVWGINVIDRVASNISLVLALFSFIGVLLSYHRRIMHLERENDYLRRQLSLQHTEGQPPEPSPPRRWWLTVFDWRKRLPPALVMIGLSIAVLGGSVYLWSQHRETVRSQGDRAILTQQLAYSNGEKIALNDALRRVELLPNVEGWEAEHRDEYSVRFWVTDDEGRPIAGCRASVPETGEQAVTFEGGLTGSLWMRLGNKALFEKEGHERRDVFLDLEKAKKPVIHVKLRRKDHVSREIAQE